MLTATRTVVLFRRTHPTSIIPRSTFNREATRDSLRNAHSAQPRHYLASPQSGPGRPDTAGLRSPNVVSNGTAKANALPTRSLSIGLASGALGAMCGIGGSVFAIPALVRFHSLPQRVAAGSSLAAVTAVGVTGAASFHSACAVDISVAAPLAFSASLFTPLGARAASFVNATVLRRALGAFMLLLAPALPLRGALSRQRDSKQAGLQSDIDGKDKRNQTLVNEPIGLAAASSTSDSERPGVVALATAPSGRTAGLAAAGAAVGITSGLLGVSGGALFTPLIAALCPDMPFRTVMGTSFASMIIPAAIGALSYARMQMAAPALIPALIIGAALGARLGSSVALAVPDQVLHLFFASVFAVMGLRTLRAPLVQRATSTVAGVHGRATTGAAAATSAHRTA